MAVLVLEVVYLKAIRLSIRAINADQNTLTTFRNGWSADDVGYVLNVLHEGPPVAPYPGGFSAVLRDMRIALPRCEMASYISLAYAKNLGAPCSPRRCLPAEAFEASELNADGTIRYERSATRRKVVELMRAELGWRKDTELLTSVWFDDFPTPFDPQRLDQYVEIVSSVRNYLLPASISTRVNASNLFYASQTAGELEALAKCCDGMCLEGEQLNEERKDKAKFNYRLQVIAERQSAITIIAPASVAEAGEKAYLDWTSTLVDDLQPAIATGKVFIGYPCFWSAPKWAKD